MTAVTFDRAAQLNAVVGANVRELRKQLGLSQNQLADVAGIAPSMVAFVEIGTRRTFTTTFPKLADGLGVQPYVLLIPKAAILPRCPQCQDTPPAGYTCNRCRARGK